MSSKKRISFGKIAFGSIAKRTEEAGENNIDVVSGFGTFGKQTKPNSTVHRESEVNDITHDLEKQSIESLIGIKDFGRKAKVYDVEKMMEEVKKTAKVVTPQGEENRLEKDDDEDFIGPPLPPAITEDSKETRNAVKGQDEKEEDEDSYNELSDSEDEGETQQSRIPMSHEVKMEHGSKAVVAVAADPSGARLSTGSIDYDVCFWDFAGMDSSLKSFRTLRPCENHPIKCLQYSSTGDAILVVSGSAQAKVLDRDGFEKMECVKGDMYITDMAKTKGHTAALNSGCWHPYTREEFMTSANDGTLRLWDVENPREQKNVIKPRAQGGTKVNPFACSFSRDGNTVIAGCFDGSIQMWDHRKNFVNTSTILRGAHQNHTEISSISYSYHRSHLATRGCDDTLKLWDLRSFKKPIHVINDLFSRYDSTDCMFSPDDTMIITGESLKKGQKSGRVLFYDVNTFNLTTQIEVTDSHVIKTLWHPKLNQIFVGCGNGTVKCFYDEKRSIRGAKLCVVKTHKKRVTTEIMSTTQVITPHALPLFRQDRIKTNKKQLEKDRLDPMKSKRPDLPITSGQGGRVASSGGTLSSYVIRNLGLSKRVNDEQNPRDAILKYAKEAEENPFWIAPAYKKTQPKPIFQDSEENNDDENGPSSSKKLKL